MSGLVANAPCGVCVRTSAVTSPLHLSLPASSASCVPPSAALLPLLPRRLQVQTASSSSSSSSSFLRLQTSARERQWCRRSHGVVVVAATAARAMAAAAAAAEKEEVAILINGCGGKMGREVAKAALEAGVTVAPWGITGPGLPRETIDFPLPLGEGVVSVEVVPSEERDGVMDKALERWPGLIVVDYTLPDAVNGNAEWYVSRKVPFVMGTTGGDRAKMLKEVEESGVYAVIAAQMGKQVVAFISAMETLAQTCPGAFAGYKLSVVESHQSTKVDTSGTAKDVVAAFQKLGVADFTVDQIEKVRSADEQMGRMGVPEPYLNAHAFHTYRLVSPDNTVSFEFQHNVCGRSIYAQGAIDAVLFLRNQIKTGASKTLYNMIDVLNAGSMR